MISWILRQHSGKNKSVFDKKTYLCSRYADATSKISNYRPQHSCSVGVKIYITECNANIDGRDFQFSGTTGSGRCREFLSLFCSYQCHLGKSPVLYRKAS